MTVYSKEHFGLRNEGIVVWADSLFIAVLHSLFNVLEGRHQEWLYWGGRREKGAAGMVRI